MNAARSMLMFSLRIAAVMQVWIAVVSLVVGGVVTAHGAFLAHDSAARELFFVHLALTSLTTLCVAGLTFRFAEEMARGEQVLARWLAGTVGAYWFVRATLHLVYMLSASRIQWPTGELHLLLLAVYGGLAGIYITSVASTRED